MGLRAHAITFAMAALLIAAACGDDRQPRGAAAGTGGSTASGTTTAPTTEAACATYCEGLRQCDPMDSSCEPACEADINDADDRVAPDACRRSRAIAIECLGLATCLEMMIDTDDPQHPCYAEFEAIDCAYPSSSGQP